MLDKNKEYPFEHVVVLMMENRSFDNLLGYLYENGVPEGKEFEGLQGKDLSNPVSPEWGEKLTETNEPVKVHQACDYNQPYPDPGEVYPHINTQLFNELNGDNVGKSSTEMVSPFNLPNPVPAKASMTGFVNDYINVLVGLAADGAKEYETISRAQYEVIMQCFKPDDISVLATLAKEFSVFDHWHCSVPSQTWCNRAFWHAATSAGYVINPTEGENKTGADYRDKLENLYSWINNVWSKPTLFSRMEDKEVSHKVYSGSHWSEIFDTQPLGLKEKAKIPEPSYSDKQLLKKLYDNKEDLFGPLSLTQLIHGPSNVKNIGSMEDFYKDLENKELPLYSFIEPNILGQHNDQHPCAYQHENQVGTVLLGEQLIWDIYEAIRLSSYKDKILFVITHDEHGGCFDHVSPPSAVPPEKNMCGQDEFKFDRLGVRVPMVMVSSYIDPNTIINEEFDHTAFIHSLSDKWDLAPLTDRDKKASSFSSVFSKVKRSKAWPVIDKPIVSTDDKHLPNIDYGEQPLNGLQRSILNAVLAILDAPSQPQEKDKSRQDFITKLNNVATVAEAIECLTSQRDK